MKTVPWVDGDGDTISLTFLLRHVRIQQVFMNQQKEERPLLTDRLPSVSTDLRQLLEEQGEPELAAQVSELKIVERRRCGDDFCATFYAKPKPNGAHGLSHRNVRLMPEEGC